MDWFAENLVKLLLILGVLAVIVAGVTMLWKQRHSRIQKQKVVVTQPGATPPTQTTTTTTVKTKPLVSVRKIVAVIVAILLCLAFLDYIVALGKLAGMHILAGTDAGIRGTPRSEWGIGVGSQPTMPVAPQGKSVGGPLLWSKNANVKIRGRIKVEEVDARGVYFGLILPPHSESTVKLSAYDKRTPWYAFLIDYTRMKRFLDPEALHLHGTTKTGMPAGIIRCEQLSQMGSEVKHPKNFPVDLELCEVYGQLTDNFPQTVDVDVVKQTEGISQYEVEVGANEISFIVPNQNWKWLWIAPVHHPCYQSRFTSTVVSATGLTLDEATRVARSDPKLSSKVELTGEGYQQNERFQAILLGLNEETKILSEAVLLQQTDVTNGSISIRLNIPREKSFSQFVKPAKIIVGIQL